MVSHCYSRTSTALLCRPPKQWSKDLASFRTLPCRRHCRDGAWAQEHGQLLTGLQVVLTGLQVVLGAMRECRSIRELMCFSALLHSRLRKKQVLESFTMPALPAEPATHAVTQGTGREMLWVAAAL